MINFDTAFIKNTALTDKFARTLAERMSEAIEDELNDVVHSIATDHIPAPEDGGDDAFFDAFAEQVENPLYDHLLKQIIHHLL